MKICHIVFASCVGLLILMGFDAAHADTAYQMTSVTMLQPEQVMERRAADVSALAEYIANVDATLEKSLKSFSPHCPAQGSIFIAVRPNRTSKTWLAFNPALPDKLADMIISTVQSIPPFPAQEGIVVFSLQTKLWDGTSTAQPRQFPKEWLAIPKQNDLPTEASEIADLAWGHKNEPAVQSNNLAPSGFVQQILDPTGGAINRPKDWFYTQMNNPAGYTWTISHEDSKNGAYQTGMKIQLLTGIQEYTHVSSSDFIKHFISEKKRSAVSIIKSCPEQTEDNFQTICLESEEIVPALDAKEKFHIIYTGYWNNELDIAFMTTFGAPSREWDKTNNIAANMSSLKLLDMARLPTSSGHDSGECIRNSGKGIAKKIHDYVAAGHKSRPGIYSIGGVGNHKFLFNGMHLITTDALAAQIKADPKYGTIKVIELNWPYSGLWSAPYLHEMASKTGKEVVGVDGALWWLPDGSAVVTSHDAHMNKGIEASQITQCILSDGTILRGSPCQEKLKTYDLTQAIFGNAMFAPYSCDELSRKIQRAFLGDRNYAMELYFFNDLVNVDPQAAANYLGQAVVEGHPLAEYFFAHVMEESDKDMSRKFLKLSAQHGDKKAAEELQGIGNAK